VIGAVPASIPNRLDFGLGKTGGGQEREMFDTELTRDYEAATSLGLSLRFFYEAGVAGALCDETTKRATARDRRALRLERSRAGGPTDIQWPVAGGLGTA